MSKGFIYAICANCGEKIRVEVDFPVYNKPFNTKIINCPECNEELKIFDLHEYNENGTIKD